MIKFPRFKLWYFQLRCKHTYVKTGEYIDALGTKNLRFECDDCHKVKWQML